ncbi:MAG: T9SS type A sorting domain-containing protein [Bacteroidales bacterium]|nr:T9SS type A sorting domain-containing protein [Bacteroidales bacterium]
MSKHKRKILLLFLLPCVLLITSTTTGYPAETKNTPVNHYVELEVLQPQNVEYCYEALSMDEVHEASEWLHLFPNPGYGVFTLKMTGLAYGNLISITVYNMSGHQVYKSHSRAGGDTHSMTLRLESLPAGVYVVHASSANRLAVHILTIL